MKRERSFVARSSEPGRRIDRDESNRIESNRSILKMRDAARSTSGAKQQFRRESHHFEVELFFSNVFFIATNSLCVSVSFYTTFLPFIETRRTKRLLYFRHFYDRDPPSESCNFRGIVAARDPVRVRVRGSTREATF